MLFLSLRVDQYVIDEDNNKLIQIFMENLVHKVHEYRRSICQSKRHDQEFKLHILGVERRLRNILLPDLDLMVA
ncbi:Uncharacterized protein M6B38_233045 [Iris pallida]|uniref:Uncharacterized protein n=1 Tax=Iris pallida TaxID=29817 RepID=A0AAX6DQ84_IRIPA|nr:Uncharacterized protein M6B38_233045 [Iris pallida]